MKQHEENGMEVNHGRGVTLIKKKKNKLKFKSAKLSKPKQNRSLDKNNKNLLKKANKLKKLLNLSGGNYVESFQENEAQINLDVNKTLTESSKQVKNRKLKKVKRYSTSVISKNTESDMNIHKPKDTLKLNGKNLVGESCEKKKIKKHINSKKLKNGKKGEGQMSKTMLNSTTDEYKPGMLSELLQEKKFGQVIIPWDGSFGLDPKYSIQKREIEENKQIPNLKVNPLFDLSKRKRENSAPEDTIANIIFVGNLPNNTTISTIKKLFRKFGLVLYVKLRSRGLKADKKLVNASVKFNNFESCREALKLNGKEFEGHHLRVTLANEKVKSDVQNTVFVGNLAFDAEDDDLWKVFADCGEIESVRVVRDDRSGKGKGFGYVNFKSEDAVDLALKLNGTSFLDRNIRVSRSTSHATSLSNADKVKRRRKKKKSSSGSKSDNGELKHKLDKSRQQLDESGNILKIKRKSTDFHNSKTEVPVLKKVKKEKKILKKSMNSDH